jgi:hypothetical protein
MSRDSTPLLTPGSFVLVVARTQGDEGAGPSGDTEMPDADAGRSEWPFWSFRLTHLRVHPEERFTVAKRFA